MFNKEPRIRLTKWSDGHSTAYHVSLALKDGTWQGLYGSNSLEAAKEEFDRYVAIESRRDRQTIEVLYEWP